MMFVNVLCALDNNVQLLTVQVMKDYKDIEVAVLFACCRGLFTCIFKLISC